MCNFVEKIIMKMKLSKTEKCFFPLAPEPDIGGKTRRQILNSAWNSGLEKWSREWLRSIPVGPPLNLARRENNCLYGRVSHSFLATIIQRWSHANGKYKTSTTDFRAGSGRTYIHVYHAPEHNFWKTWLISLQCHVWNTDILISKVSWKFSHKSIRSWNQKS